MGFDLNAAIEEAVNQALKEKLKPLVERIDELQAKLKKPALQSLMTPSQVASYQKCRLKTVYTALHNGTLPSTQRPARSGKMGYLVRPEDATKWMPQGAVAGLN